MGTAIRLIDFRLMIKISNFKFQISNYFFGIIFGFIISLFIVFSIYSQVNTNISYPIPELGNCSNKQDCKTYCDLPEYVSACLDFAQLHGLLSDHEIVLSRKVSQVKSGPGGCTDHATCQVYCEEIDNLEACLEYASKEGILSPLELDEARRVTGAMKAGYEPPGNCKTKSQCEAYCSEPKHMDDCLGFARAVGLMSEAELEEAQKVANAIAAGHSMPGNCRGKRQCEAYCNNSNNVEECLEFGIAAGFVNPSEAEEARKVLPLLKSGQTPGKCKSRSQCEAYCANPNNAVECTEFAVKAGFVSAQEASKVRKILPLMRAGQTPGKCKSKTACEAYCKNPVNQKECFEFAKKAGLISATELRKMSQGKEELQNAIRSAKPKVRTCIVNLLGDKVVGQVEAGTLAKDHYIGEGIEECFEQYAPKPYIPNEIRPCLESRLGVDYVRDIENGARTGREEEAVFRKCHELKALINKNDEGYIEENIEVEEYVEEKIFKPEYVEPIEPVREVSRAREPQYRGAFVIKQDYPEAHAMEPIDRNYFPKAGNRT
jgi:hypothetical protein